MITGYNTDVKHNNRVFHIQTEDKGEGSPYVESLVYVGGEILATRKTSYEELIRNGRDDQAVQGLMEQQHRTMIAAIQRGRFDGPNGSLRVPEGMSATAESEGTSAGGPAEQTSAGDRTLDQVILDYLASEGSPEQIDLTFSPAPEFVSGKRVNVRLRAELAPSRRPVAGASVQIRVLSSAKPVPVFAGMTGPDGGCEVAFLMPTIPAGTAAAVVRLTSAAGSTEIQYPVRRGV